MTLESSKTTFIDGAARANNPIEQMMNEARSLWPSREIGCLISLGTGVKLPEGFDNTKGNPRLHEVLRSLASIATDSETKARDFRATSEGRALSLRGNKKYFRFSVSQGIEQVDLADFQKLLYMGSMTTPYLIDMDDEIEDCASCLASPVISR